MNLKLINTCILNGHERWAFPSHKNGYIVSHKDRTLMGIHLKQLFSYAGTLKA